MATARRTTNRQGMQFAIGMVALLGLLGLATLIVWFGELQSVFRVHRTYYVTFTHAMGAEARAPVRRAGMRIGEIDRVDYDEKHSVVVTTIKLEGDNVLREGDEPRLKTGSLLTGDVYIDIETRADMRGRPDRRPIAPGSVIEGRPPLDLGATAESAQTVIPNANQTLDDLSLASKQWTVVGERTQRILEQNEKELNVLLQQSRESIERLNTTLQSFNDTLDKRTQANIRLTMQNLADSSNELQPLVESSRRTVSQIETTTKKLDEVAGNLQTATKPLADRSESTTRNLDVTTRNLASASEDLAVMLRRFDRSDGTLKRLLEDPKLYQNLDDAAVKLNKSLGELEFVLKDLSVFADKIARHPGELGVQGALTKDKGAKHVPPSELKQAGERPRKFR
jgi:phospholipid/cholesterol/gamma-HCH transport system substrate-binding protein